MSAVVEDNKIKIKYSLEVAREDQQWVDDAKQTLEELQSFSANTLIGGATGGVIGGAAAAAMTQEQVVQDAITQEIESSVQDAIEQATGQPSILSRLNKNILRDEARVAQQVSTIARVGVEAQVMSLAKSVPFIAAIVAAPKLMEFIINELIKPGGELDRRFRLIVEEVYLNQRSREHNWAVQKGDKQLIIASYPVGTGPGHVSNNLEKIRKNPGRVLDHGIDMKGEGLRRD